MLKYKTFKRFVTIIAVLYTWMPPYSNHMHCSSMNNTIDIRIWPQKQVSITNKLLRYAYGLYLSKKKKKRITTSVRVFFWKYCV